MNGTPGASSRHHIRTVVLAAACGLAGTACGTSSVSRRLSVAPPALTRANPNSAAARVDRDELASGLDMSFEEALRRLRPEWLRATMVAVGTMGLQTASVYVDDVYTGELDALRTIPTGAVRDVRYLSPSAARIVFGMFCRCAGGVILVSTRESR